MRPARHAGSLRAHNTYSSLKDKPLAPVRCLGVFRYHPPKARFSGSSREHLLEPSTFALKLSQLIVVRSPHRRIYFSSVIRGAAGILTAGILIALWTAAIFLRMLMIWRPVKRNFFMPVRDGFCENLQFKGVRFL